MSYCTCAGTGHFYALQVPGANLVSKQMTFKVVGLDKRFLAEGAGIILLQGMSRLNVLHQVGPKETFLMFKIVPLDKIQYWVLYW
jgi:hypothetical protein